MFRPGTLLAGALLFQFVLNILFIFSKFGKLVHGWQVLCFALFDILRFSKSHVPIRLAGALLFSIFQYSLQILHISQPGTWLADALFFNFFVCFVFVQYSSEILKILSRRYAACTCFSFFYFYRCFQNSLQILQNSEPGTLLAGALLFQFVFNILFIFSKFGITMFVRHQHVCL